MGRSFVIGLTGNIASGKSLVAAMLAELGAQVIDADEVAHECLAAGSRVAGAVAERFGTAVLLPGGSVDRRALGRIVFADPGAMADLEGIIHPPTRERILARLRDSRAAVVIIEAIKLLESPLLQSVDSVWVVTAPRELRIERLAQRGFTPAEAAQRVEAQNPEKEKVRRADVVIPNDGSLLELRGQVRRSWATLAPAMETARGG